MTLLRVRPRSHREMKERLIRRFGEHRVEDTIGVLRKRGLLDDRAFAMWWVEERMRFKPMGRYLLQKELAEKGIPREIARGVLDEAMRDSGESELAVEAGRHVMKRYDGLPHDVARRRLGAFLTRRGFGSESVQTAISRLLGEDPA